jgi:two-component system CheB/CheR fusion protein
MADVLIAGNNALARFKVSRALSRRGHRTRGVRNGAEVLEALENQGFDLLVLDLALPVLDGAATAEIIRASRRPYAAIPILAVAGLEPSGDRERFLAAGADAFLPKPLDSVALLALLDQVLARRAA